MHMADDHRTVFETGFSLVIQRQPVLTAFDIQSCCDHEIPLKAIETTLSKLTTDGTLIKVSPSSGSHLTSYVITDYATRWWIERVLGWHAAGVLMLKREELACSMSITFGQGLWFKPDIELLNLGIEIGMIAPTERGESFVSPWVNLLRTVPEARQYLSSTLRAVHPHDLLTAHHANHPIPDFSGLLEQRERFVISERQLNSRTLEDIGDMLCVTRERVRQIEKTAMRRPDVRQALVTWLASYFVNNSCSLIIDNNNKSFGHAFNHILNGRKYHLELLGSIVLMDEKWIGAVNQIMTDRDSVLAFVVEGFQTIPETLELLLTLLPVGDASRIRAAALSSLQQQADELPRKSKVYIALKIIGDAAHYTEVIEVCDSLWPNQSGSNETYINALSASAKTNENGVVHIGRKGMYGLIEHGYTQPTQGLTETVAEIVRDEYRRTGSAVSVDVVFDRTHDYRQYPDKKSVAMALSFNKGLKSVGQSRYLPSEATAQDENSQSSGASSFDFSSALHRLQGRDDHSTE